MYFRHNNIREIAEDVLKRIPLFLKHIWINSSVIMPNHLHLIISINKWVGRHARNNFNITRRGETNPQDFVSPLVSPLRVIHGNRQPKYPPRGTTPGSIGAIVGKIKSLISRKTNIKIGKEKIVWQRDYYDHIIRDTKEYNQIKWYIINNPKKWRYDRNNPKSCLFNSKKEQNKKYYEWYKS